MLFSLYLAVRQAAKVEPSLAEGLLVADSVDDTANAAVFLMIGAIGFIPSTAVRRWKSDAFDWTKLHQVRIVSEC